ncbi:MAG: hypothetical protein ACPG5L_15875 [Vibrio gallaecicus]
MSFKQEVVKTCCKFPCEELAQEHCDSVLSKAPQIIDKGVACSEKLGWHTWRTTKEWKSREWDFSDEY